MPLTNTQLKQLRRSPVGASGNRLAIAIKLSGETGAVIATALGFTAPYLSDVSRGRWQTITVANARKLADHFGCQIEDLFPAKAAVAS